MILAATTVAGCEMVFNDIDRSRIDFATLARRTTPNDYLVCPPGLCAAKADRESPVFETPVAALEARWRTMLARQPRVEAAEAYPDDRQYDFIQRTALMRYPDTVTARFLELEDGRSTLAVYSRSHYGRSDFGANRKRVEAWLAALTNGG